MKKQNVEISDKDLMLFDCIEKNQTKAFLDAVKKYENITDIRDQFGNTLLMSLVDATMLVSSESSPKNEGAMEILLGLTSWKSVIDEKNQFGKTALMKASEKRHGTGIVKQLLDAGASVDVRDKKHYPAVVLAAWQKVDTSVALLMEYGKDVYLKDIETQKSWTRILKAAWVNNFKITSGLLAGSVSDWDAREFASQELARRKTEEDAEFALYLDSLVVVSAKKPTEETDVITPEVVDSKTTKPNGHIRAQG